MARPRKFNGHKPSATGDLGTGAPAAIAGTEVQELPTDDGKRDPNNRLRRYRVEAIENVKFLSMRQLQAARKIRNAYCKVAALSSGRPLQDPVDSSARPDAAAARQADVMSELVRLERAIPREYRATVEAMCRYNVRISEFPSYRQARTEMELACTALADFLRF